MTTGRRNQTRTVLVLASIVVGMAGLSFAAVPLYDLFCRVTGYGGTTQVDDTGGAARSVLDRVITVRFNADVNDALPWTFEPVAHTMDLRVGMDALAYYRAESVSAVTTAGTSTFNVTPAKAGQYFVKLDCFCFTEQTLAGGEATDMAVSFYIDPSISDDPNLNDVSTITLSYTFFPIAEDRMTQRSALASPTANDYN